MNALPTPAELRILQILRDSGAVTEEVSKAQSLRTELIVTACGLAANAHPNQKHFTPKPETIQKWADLMTRAAEELR